MFNVIIYDFNRKQFVPYDIIPYFVNAYKERKEKKYKKVPKTLEEFIEFVKEESRYQFWGKCEYEIILVDWPNQKAEKKIDVHEQIMMNIECIAILVMAKVGL